MERGDQDALVPTSANHLDARGGGRRPERRLGALARRGRKRERGCRRARQLRRIVDEAVLLQGLTEDMLAGIRLRRSFRELAAPGRALISRFDELRAAVPEPLDARLRDVAQTLRETLDHHALMLHCSLDLLADLRPERVAGQRDQLTGLGAPARRLCALQEQLNGAYGGQRPSRVA